MLNSTGEFRGFRWGLLIPVLLLAASCSSQEATTQERRAGETTVQPEATEAEAALAAALAEGEKDDRLVFLHTGADW